MMAFRSPNPAIREVARGLAGARDAQILRAVAMVDAMPDRGAADQIVAPSRARLARLRPPRPLRFARLLFLPLDPLIVPPARWRPEQAVIPRSVIPVLANAVEAALGPTAARIHAMIDGRTTADKDVLAAAGDILWTAAPACLMNPRPPADWDSTGLAVRFHAPLARRIATLLTWAEPIQSLSSHGTAVPAPPDPAALQALLVSAAPHGPDVQTGLIALILARCPEAGPSLAPAARLLGPPIEAMIRHARDQASETLLEQLETEASPEARLGGQDLVETSLTVRRMTSLLALMEAEPGAAARRDRLHAVRNRIRAACEAVFTEQLSTRLREPLREIGLSPNPDALWALEDAARGLRMLESEARRAGGGPGYDAALAQTASEVRRMICGGASGQAEALRLLELLLGPAAALALIGEEA